METTTYTIGKLAQAAGINVETIRYYQRIGLLAVPVRHKGEIRRYNIDALRRLLFIRHARELGLSLRAIASMMWTASAKGCNEALRTPSTARSCQEARNLFTLELARLEQQIAELLSQRGTLNAVLAKCRKADSAALCAVFDCIVNRKEKVSGHT